MQSVKVIHYKGRGLYERHYKKRDSLSQALRGKKQPQRKWEVARWKCRSYGVVADLTIDHLLIYILVETEQPA